MPSTTSPSHGTTNTRLYRLMRIVVRCALGRAAHWSQLSFSTAFQQLTSFGSLRVLPMAVCVRVLAARYWTTVNGERFLQVLEVNPNHFPKDATAAAWEEAEAAKASQE